MPTPSHCGFGVRGQALMECREFPHSEDLLLVR